MTQDLLEQSTQAAGSSARDRAVALEPKAYTVLGRSASRGDRTGTLLALIECVA
jgi:hypothetical protein